MENLLNLTTDAPLSLSSLAINMLLGIVLGSLVAWFYKVYGRSFSNRSKLAAILPVLVLIVALIISIVKVVDEDLARGQTSSPQHHGQTNRQSHNPISFVYAH